VDIFVMSGLEFNILSWTFLLSRPAQSVRPRSSYSSHGRVSMWPWWCWNIVSFYVLLV